MPSISDIISYGLREFEGFWKLGNIGITRIKNRVKTPYRVEKLADDVFTSKLKYGAVVTVKGKLTRYGTTYRPSTYAPQIYTAASDSEINNWKINPFTKQRERKINLKASTSLFQFPVQTLPSFEDKDGKYYIAFLYPDDFDSFILKGDKNRVGGTREDGLLIDHNHQPIPILLPELGLENFSEYEVALTGVVSNLPASVTEAISSNLCSTREAFYHHFLRLYSMRISFCIDCRDKLNSDLDGRNKLESLNAALYIEGHFEGILEDKYKDIFQKSIPNSLECVMNLSTCPGKEFYLTSDENVSVIGVAPNAFGFYTEANLLDPRDFKFKLENLKKFYTSFRKSVSNTIRETHSIEARFKPDFIFDFSRQN